ncbi:hypothetical protein [Actinospongicola halichondriae]|uniref:hypothetical protein n=1 Tax=Actinospongicola halichondriae TaxID=3236844 RepID=UPI003D531FB0
MTYLVLLGICILAVGGYVALRNAQDFSDANEVVPGVATKAPKGWAGAHSPEARLHRRLRDAILALQANASLDDPAMAPVRSSIEEQALGVDDKLIAAAALPKARREDPIRQVEQAVIAIEGAVASVVDLRGPSMTAIDQGLADVQARMRNVEAARAELEAMTSPSSSTFDAIRQHIEDEEDPGATPTV